MMIMVITPNKNYDKIIAGVRFVKGVGKFKDEALGKRIAEQLGFEVEEEKKEKSKSSKAKKSTK